MNVKHEQHGSNFPNEDMLKTSHEKIHACPQSSYSVKMTESKSKMIHYTFHGTRMKHAAIEHLAVVPYNHSFHLFGVEWTIHS